jgi:hypothetical protein
MSPIKLLAVIFILAGAVGLAYGNFSYTKETHDAKIGPLEFSVKDKERVQIPQWLSAIAIGSGLLMLVLDRRTS